MSRLLVEGRTRIQHIVPFPDQNPVIVQPEPAADTLNACQRFTPLLNGFQAPACIYNPDDVAHNFRAFLRGAAGMNRELGAPGLAAPIIVGPGALVQLEAPHTFSPNMLIPQFRLEFEMQEALNTPGAEPVFTTWYETVLDQLLTVKGRKYSIQVDTMDDQNPSILSCPLEGVRSRSVVALAPDANVPGALAVESYFRNRDNNPAQPPLATKTLTFTLTDPVNPDVVIDASQVVAEGSEGLVRPVTLLPGQTLVASIAEATVTTDPLMYWVYADQI